MPIEGPLYLEEDSEMLRSPTGASSTTGASLESAGEATGLLVLDSTGDSLEGGTPNNGTGASVSGTTGDSVGA